jgi:hypothetical protein
MGIIATRAIPNQESKKCNNQTEKAECKKKKNSY